VKSVPSAPKILATNIGKVVKTRKAKPAPKATDPAKVKSQRRLSSFGVIRSTKSTITTTTEDREEVHEHEVVETLRTTKSGDSTTTFHNETTVDRTTIIKKAVLDLAGTKRKLSEDNDDDDFVPTKVARKSQELNTLDSWFTERPRRKARDSVSVRSLTTACRARSDYSSHMPSLVLLPSWSIKSRRKSSRLCALVQNHSLLF
jgi:hypothetical protein